MTTRWKRNDLFALLFSLPSIGPFLLLFTDYIQSLYAGGGFPGFFCYGVFLPYLSRYYCASTAEMEARKEK
jgi:hypothetical protein